jgi:hypothetical protein
VLDHRWDGGRGPSGGFVRAVDEGTRYCHVYFPDNRKSAWIEPEDLLLVPGQIEWVREGDWIDCVWASDRGQPAPGDRERRRLVWLSVEGVFEDTVVHTALDNVIAPFQLIAGGAGLCGRCLPTMVTVRIRPSVSPSWRL